MQHANNMQNKTNIDFSDSKGMVIGVLFLDGLFYLVVQFIATIYQIMPHNYPEAHTAACNQHTLQNPSTSSLYAPNDPNTYNSTKN